MRIVHRRLAVVAGLAVGPLLAGAAAAGSASAGSVSATASATSSVATSSAASAASAPSAGGRVGLSPVVSPRAQPVTATSPNGRLNWGSRLFKVALH